MSKKILVISTSPARGETPMLWRMNLSAVLRRPATR